MLDDLRAAEKIISPGWFAQEEQMLRHLEQLQRSLSSTFEPSLSWSDGRWHSYRYSYAFHKFRPDLWHEDKEQIISWLVLLDEGARTVARELLKAAPPPLSSQLLFGVDAVGSAPAQFKIYFRLSSGHGAAKRRLLGRLSDQPLPDHLSIDKLHLLAFDFSARGVMAIKLYFLSAQMRCEELRAILPGEDILTRILNYTKQRVVSDVVTIYKIISSSNQSIRFSEVDISCTANGIRLPELVEASSTDGPDLRPVQELFERHKLLLNRLSVPGFQSQDSVERPVSADKLNLYYLLNTL